MDSNTLDNLAPTGSLVVLVGASGSGKTTFAARYPASWRVSLDQFRELATDDMADQSANRVATQIQDLLLDERLTSTRSWVGSPSREDVDVVEPDPRARELARLELELIPRRPPPPVPQPEPITPQQAAANRAALLAALTERKRVA